MIMREEGSTTRKALEDALDEGGVVPRMRMEIGSREAIREAVIMGVGVGAVSEMEYIPDPEIRMVPVSDAEMFTYAHVVCLTSGARPRLVSAFLGHRRGLCSRAPAGAPSQEIRIARDNGLAGRLSAPPIQPTRPGEDP
jgi:DNA-binding transcriptional LysR family regulator